MLYKGQSTSRGLVIAGKPKACNHMQGTLHPEAVLERIVDTFPEISLGDRVPLQDRKTLPHVLIAICPCDAADNLDNLNAL
jgi:hypothetical protein